MDKIAKDFLINDELARHMASMSEAIDTIDPREKNKVTYSGKLIMLVTLSGVFCDCQSWNDIADFARYKKDFLRRFIPDLETTPSHDTLRRFFCIIKTEKLESCYREWARNMRGDSPSIEDCDWSKVQINEGNDLYTNRHIAIDGKTIRGAINADKLVQESADKITKEQASVAKLHLVSAFLSDMSLSLGQERVSIKENEIVAIPKLLDDIDIRQGDVVTIDALGTQKKIVEKIVEKQADYLLEVKDNHLKLRQNIENDAEYLLISGRKNDFIKKAEETTEGHGFMVTRTCISCSEPSRLGFCYRDWKNLRTYGIIKTEKINIATGEIQNEKHCFISSLVNNPKLILKYKRKHWAVENGLHWQLDVTFNEDDGRKMMNSAQNFSTLTKMALTILKNYQDEDKKTSVNRKRKKAGWSDEYLTNLIDTFIKAF